MSVQRFSLYFLSVMACAVVAFPHWAPARSEAPAPAPVATWSAAREAACRGVLKGAPSLRRKVLEPPRLVASN
jgi:hypothetical protein